MNRIPSRILAVVLLLLLGAPVTAGPLEEGFDAFEAQNYEKAFALWKPLADEGDPEAQYNLGILYMNGWGVEKNDRRALEWFVLAGRQGMADAQYNAGLLFSLGRGVYPSNKDAVAWWELAAEKGHVNAVYNLGVMYAYGWGVGQDIQQALKYWKLAAQKGHPEARATLAKAYREGLFGLDKDPDKAAQWSEQRQ